MQADRPKKPSVLVIEDDPGHQRLLELYFKRAGCECRCCSDGKTGLQEAVEGTFDLIFVDINIPELDGFMVATLLRERDAEVTLIAITALELEEIKQKALSVGYTDFLQKPLDQDIIESVLDRYFFSKQPQF